VNNDPDGRDLRLPSHPSIASIHEPEPGIPFARNRGVSAALPWADVIAFIDDDEVPADADWLAQLAGPLASGVADVTTGPVAPVFPPDVPHWIRRHPLFERQRHADMVELDQAYTHNAAARATVFTEHDLWFDDFGSPFELAFLEGEGIASIYRIRQPAEVDALRIERRATRR
jgi:glycosyltransferase involved in cell wall biosynthesis